VTPTDGSPEPEAQDPSSRWCAKSQRTPSRIAACSCAPASFAFTASPWKRAAEGGGSAVSACSWSRGEVDVADRVGATSGDERVSTNASQTELLMSKRVTESAGARHSRGNTTGLGCSFLMSRKSLLPHFVTCAPGVEPLLHAELKALRFARVERQVGGVYFEGSAVDAMRANLELRTAVRVLRRVARFEAGGADALYDGAGAVDWLPYLPRGGTILVAAHSRESALDHTLFVEQRVKDAIVDQVRARLGERPAVDKEEPDLLVHAHLFRDRCTLLVDTSGQSLHKRGWRVFQGRAPLAETLAAAVLLASEWDRCSPLLDPFCGSGTLLVEAALLAANHAPGLFRERFAFEGFADFDARRWEALKREARARVAFPRHLRLLGSELDEGTLEGARQNLASAGLAERVELAVADAREFAPRRGWNAWVVTNPPYGERVGEGEDLRGLYRAFGDRLKEHGRGYRLALLCGAPALVRALALRFERRTPFKNGALDCELVVGTV